MCHNPADIGPMLSSITPINRFMWFWHTLAYRQGSLVRTGNRPSPKPKLWTCKMSPFGKSRPTVNIHTVGIVFLVPWPHTHKIQCIITITYPQRFVVSCPVFISFCGGFMKILFYILQGYSTGTGAIIRLPQCQWSNPEKYVVEKQELNSCLLQDISDFECIYSFIYFYFLLWMHLQYDMTAPLPWLYILKYLNKPTWIVNGQCPYEVNLPWLVQIKNSQFML